MKSKYSSRHTTCLPNNCFCESQNTTDLFFMQRALDLAAKGRGTTSPNPMVGAIVVKDGKILAEGYHRKAGEKHAEAEALKTSNINVKNATLYVTLEPCVMHENKRTPACADLIIKKDIKKVFIAIADPNPKVHKKGIKALQKAGIEVHVGLLHNEATKLNEVFFHSINSPLPFVVLKMASTLDGKIATSQGDSTWITNEYSRTFVHTMRSYYDAILTSSTTVLRDHPHLGVRMVPGKDPFRVILDRQLKTSPISQVYRDTNVIVITELKAPASKRKAFEKKHIPLKIYRTFPSLKTILKDLKKEHNITSILVEAGGTLASSLIKEKLVHKYVFFIAPKIIGEDGKNSIGPLGIKKIRSALQLKNVRFQVFSDNVMIEGNP